MEFRAAAILFDMQGTLIAPAPQPLAAPGARELLTSLPGGHWGIVTTADRASALRYFKVLEVAGPRVFVTAEDVRRSKPDPAPYLMAAERIGAAPAQCVVFEDSPAGVRSAKRAGMQVIAVLSSCERADLLEADAWIASLSEVTVGAYPGEGPVVLTVKPAGS